MARRRASDPAAIARRRAAEREAARDPNNWGLNQEALSLSAQADVATRADLAGRTVRARRQDLFDRLLARGRLSQGAFDAVRRLQDDLTVLHRAAGGVAAYAPRIDRGRAPDGNAEIRRRAGKRIEAVLSLAGPACGRLLLALVEPAAARGCPADWRAVVEQATGERLADAQGAIVRLAGENLAGAYDLVDRGRLLHRTTQGHR
jgi:hypothetical protein